MMVVTYTLTFYSIHLKYLYIGILSFLNLIKKQENFNIKQFKLKSKKVIKKQLTVLKSPTVNKSARDQYKVQVHIKSLCCSFIVNKDEFFICKVFESIILNFLNSQYLEVKIFKSVFKT